LVFVVVVVALVLAVGLLLLWLMLLLLYGLGLVGVATLILIAALLISVALLLLVAMVGAATWLVAWLAVGWGGRLGVRSGHCLFEGRRVLREMTNIENKLIEAILIDIQVSSIICGCPSSHSSSCICS